jgi:hypothetical protein
MFTPNKKAVIARIDRQKQAYVFRKRTALIFRAHLLHSFCGGLIKPETFFRFFPSYLWQFLFPVHGQI